MLREMRFDPVNPASWCFSAGTNQTMVGVYNMTTATEVAALGDPAGELGLGCAH